MTSILEFELSDHQTGDEPEISRFEVVGVSPQTFISTVCDEEGDLLEYIEEVEHNVGPTHGTIDQTGGWEKDWSAATWTIGSCEIQDRAAFIEQTIDKLQELYGWQLEKIK